MRYSRGEINEMISAANHPFTLSKSEILKIPLYFPHILKSSYTSKIANLLLIQTHRYLQEDTSQICQENPNTQTLHFLSTVRFTYLMLSLIEDLNIITASQLLHSWCPEDEGQS